jgi:hypothetical protein
MSLIYGCKKGAESSSANSKKDIPQVIQNLESTISTLEEIEGVKNLHGGLTKKEQNEKAFQITLEIDEITRKIHRLTQDYRLERSSQKKLCMASPQEYLKNLKAFYKEYLVFYKEINATIRPTQIERIIKETEFQANKYILYQQKLDTQYPLFKATLLEKYQSLKSYNTTGLQIKEFIPIKYSLTYSQQEQLQFLKQQERHYLEGLINSANSNIKRQKNLINMYTVSSANKKISSIQVAIKKHQEQIVKITNYINKKGK